VRVTGRGYRDGVRSLEVMSESQSGGNKPEIQEEGRDMELKFFLFKCSNKKFHYHVTTLGKLFTPMCLCRQPV